MSVMALLEAPVKSEEISNMKSYLAEIFPATRAYEGCQAIDAYFNTEDASKMVLVEHWDSHLQYEKYLGWRTESGVMARTLRELKGLSYQQIPALTGCPLGTVRSRLFRARLALGKQLEPLVN
jgi:DNA-directed RNA polymerase specialized sigma24 family protein